VQWLLAAICLYRPAHAPSQDCGIMIKERQGKLTFFMRNPMGENLIYGPDPQRLSWFGCGSTGSE
jgi:hypothetical protein